MEPESHPQGITLRTASLFSSKTRDRILMTSLLLFNQRSFGSVTTATIAREAGVLEGTLWYHFKTKTDIQLAHIEVLQRAFLEENKESESSDPASIVMGVFSSYDLIWDFRYLVRNRFSHHEDERLNKGRLAAQNLNDFIDEWTVNRIVYAREMGLLQLGEHQVEAISEITMVLGRYWLDYSSKKYPEATNLDLRKKGIGHVFLILDPYLSEKAKVLVKAALQSKLTA